MQRLMPPGVSPGYSYYESCNPFQAGEFGAINNNGNPAKVVGYEDIFGSHHGGTFCEWWRPDSNGPTFCGRFNNFAPKEAEYNTGLAHLLLEGLGEKIHQS